MTKRTNIEYHKLVWEIAKSKDKLDYIELAEKIIDLVHDVDKESLQSAYELGKSVQKSLTLFQKEVEQ